MAETDEFDEFYNASIAPSISRLQAECKKADRWGTIGLLSFVASMIIGYLGMMQHLIPGYGLYLLILIILAVVALVKYRNNNDTFVDDFKSAVITKIVDHIAPGVQFKPDEYISPVDYERSSLYRYQYENYTGGNLMEGNIDGLSFLFSEVYTNYVDGTTPITIFKGLFFVLQMPFSLSGCTYVWSQDNVQLARSLYDEAYRLFPMPDVSDVGFGDAAFEDSFTICSTYPAEAVAVLTPTVRERLLAISENAKNPVSFSFVGGYMYAAIASARELLEPDRYVPGNKEQVYTYYLTIQLLIGIVKLLGMGEVA